MKFFHKYNGFTLIETIVALGIFTIISLGIYFSYSNVLDIISSSQANLIALSVADNEIETVRNMAYQDVGIQGGSPPGKLLAQKNVQMSGASFLVKTFVRNIDDPFDGTIGGSPNDLAPADYKLVEIELTCPSCARFNPVITTTTVAPPNLESTSKRGSLFVHVFNASGQPISGADIHVVNNSIVPAININDTTNLSGVLQLIDIATSSAKYEITVSKQGYSSERTYSPNDPANPNPSKPHATVAKQALTEISFAIDKVSTVNLKTSDQMCVPVPNIDYSQVGSKLIGVDPDIIKFSDTSYTDTNGLKTINNLEWDTYNFQNIDPAYDISGMSLLTPLIVNPDSTYNMSWVMGNKTPLALLAVIQDQNGQFINDASVRLNKAGYDSTKISGHRLVLNTDWYNNQYSFKTNNLETDIPAGEITVKFIGGKYATSSEELVSSTIDFGSNTTSFYNFFWNPISQPPQAGPDSLRFQIATNNNDQDWVFLGPDGTTNSYYTSNNTVINSIHNNNRYLRYKILMRTGDDQFTPRLDDINIEFHSNCGLDGQSFFNGLSNATYILTVSKPGYQIFTDPSLVINKNWQMYKVILTP